MAVSAVKVAYSAQAASTYPTATRIARWRYSGPLPSQPNTSMPANPNRYGTEASKPSCESWIWRLSAR